MENQFIILKNEQLEITLCSLGASIYRIKYDGVDMLLTPKDKKDFSDSTIYYGKTIGRVCGRIVTPPDARYKLQYNNGKASLHGGFDGLSTKVFKVDAKENYVEFHYLSKDGEAGYPGNLILRVRYELIDNSLVISYHTVVDKPCLVALTNHAFFTLGDSDISKLMLKMDADNYLDVDENLIPLGMKPVSDNLKFHNGKYLRDTGDVDNYFYLNRKEIELRNDKYVLNIDSNYEGTVVYTDNFEDDVKSILSERRSHRSVAIEPQDAQTNRRELLPGEVYEKYIRLVFSKL